MSPERLAEIEARLRDTCQRLVEAVGADGPCDAEQAADRAVARLAEMARERDDLGRLTDRLRERLMTLDRERNRALAQLSAYTDLPPEPDTAMGAFMAVLEVDNDPEEPDNYAGDCDAEATTWPDDARWRPLTEPAPEGEEVEVCVVAISFTHGEYTIPTLGTFADGDWDHAAPRGNVYAWRPRQPVPTPPKGES